MVPKRTLSSWLPVFLYAALIFYFSCLPGKCIPEPIPLSDKVFHYLEYFPFGLLLTRAFSRTLIHLSLRSLLLIVFVVLLYALSDEIHQLFVPDRFFSFLDMFVDVLGGVSGGFIYLWRR
ncbi:MAG: VanZ family protein [Candidatus Omnitrophica bacterium]|nr:VanZ family protein [Candidatus Omnitrophota bacterium]